MGTTAGLVVQKQGKNKTDFCFQAMEIGSMQLMYIRQRKNF